MNKVITFFKDKKEIILTCLVILILLMLPYFKSVILVGADYMYHFTRIDTIKEALTEGIFPVKVHTSMANGFGYGTGFFYPNFFLYIGAIIELIVVDFFLAYKIFIAVVLLMIFICSYISFKYVLEDKISALIATSIYMLSNCLTLHLYQRAAIGEFVGLAFVPLVIAGLYDYTDKDFKKPYLLFLGFFGIINSHLISAFLCAAYAVVIFFAHIKVTLKNKKNFLKLVVCAILVAMTTASFWMPMFEQMMLAKYKYNEPWILVEETKFGIVDLFGIGPDCFGLLITICTPMIIIGLFDKKIPKNIKRYIIEFIVLVAIMISPWFWHLTKAIFGLIQFKWRLINITTVIAAIIITELLRIYSSKFKINYKIIWFIVLLLLVIFVFPQNSLMIYKEEAEAEAKINSKWHSLGGGTEYLPLELNVNDLALPSVAITGNFHMIPITKERGVVSFEMDDANQNTVYPPFIYYYGYVADITDEAGVVQPLEVRKSEKGLIEVVTEGKTGNIRVWYNGTKIQKISYIITITAFLFIISYGVYNVIKRKVKKI